MSEAYRNIPARLDRVEKDGAVSYTVALLTFIFNKNSNGVYIRQKDIPLTSTSHTEIVLHFPSVNAYENSSSKIFRWNEFMVLLDYLYALSEGIFVDKRSQALPLVRVSGTFVNDGTDVSLIPVPESTNNHFKPVRSFEATRIIARAYPNELFPTEAGKESDYYWQFNETAFKEKMEMLTKWAYDHYSIPRNSWPKLPPSP